MRRFKAFVVKEFYHIFRDTKTLIILFGMPIVQIMLFGYAITNEIKDAKIAILDKSKDHLTVRLSDKILSSGYFQLSEYLYSEAEIEEVFRKGEVKQVVIYDKQFAQKLERDHQAKVQILADATDPNTANTLIKYTSSIINSFQQELAFGNPTPLTIKPEIRMLYNPNLESVFLFVPGLISVILMLISAMMTSISIAREKEIGTMEVLLASPMQPAQVIISKVIPYLILAFSNAIVILLLGYLVFGVPIRGSLLLLLLESILFIVMALSMGILISTITNSQQTALLISLMGLMLPTILLSGFIFPVENMPMPLQLISHLIPAKWFILILKSIMLKGTGILFFWKETLILVGFTFAFTFLSVKKFKIRVA
ncbi:MAG: transport permease protein [Cyclobacteriaceae bacterium]|nr:MAG: transport permease protein [Cyclobacteriaceae bacterium]